MKYFKFILILCIAHINSALASDSIKIVNPVYVSSLEKSLFDDFIQKKNANTIMISLALDSTLNKQSAEQYIYKLNSFIAENSDKIKNATNDKNRVNYITKVLTKEYLKKYEPADNLTSLFNEGKYAIISALIVYSTILDKMEIPYSISEKSGVITLMTYPSTSAIPITFKNIKPLVYIPDQELKTNFVDFLLDSKMISKSELSKKGTDVIFEEHFFAKSDLTITGLVGYQYFNKAIDFINKQDYKNAVHALEKSYILYPSDRTFFLLNQTLIEIVQEDAFSDFDNVPYFSKLASYTTANSIRDFVIGKFSMITNDYLVTTDRVDWYDKIYDRLNTDIPNNEIKKQISDIYYLSKSRYLIVKQDYNKAWDVIVNAYKNNPENYEAIELLQNLFLEISRKKLRTDNFEEYYFKKIEEYPILTKNDKVLMLGGYYYAENIREIYFLKDDLVEDKTLSEFEEFMKKYNYQPESYIVGQCYGEIASYYYRKHDHKKCKATINRGLQISPGNKDLINKYRINYPNEGK